MLVAGVTGGATLIESARIRGFINEIMEYKQAVYTFKVVKDRLPGDLDGDGRFGESSGEVYGPSSFSAPYNTDNNEYKIPGEWGGFFVDLYLERVIDFQPKNSNTKNIDESVPISVNNKNVYYYPWYFNEERAASEGNDNKHHNYRKKLSNNLVAHGVDEKLEPKFLKNFDIKFDDGNYQNGKVRSGCQDMEYDSAINNKKSCSFTIIEFEI